ncbi:MAG: hypothetical protein U5K54_21930 [Cytophagales bacterium]|nr:hypothetical protein [Cytophagales bacterium]
MGKRHLQWKINSWTSVPLPTYEAFKTADSNIKQMRWLQIGVVIDLITVGENRLIKKGYYASEEFLEMFEFPLITGLATQVMDDHQIDCYYRVNCEGIIWHR